MEILFVALVLTLLLTLAPVRSRGGPPLVRPASICRYVDIKELRRPGLRPGSRLSRKETALHTAPALEPDLVETVVCESTRLIASTRSGVLFVRTEERPEA